MNPLRAVARTLVPPGVKDRIKVWPWRACDLSWTLRSGLDIRLETRSEWLVYNDIFVDGEYDRPIAETLMDARGRPARILDLGANLGFFAVRVGDMAWRSGHQSPGAAPEFQMTCVEGSPRNFAELTDRIGRSKLPPTTVRLVHGLAGERSGQAVIHESAHMNGMNSILTRDGAGTPVPFVNLDDLYPPGQSGDIDLLKCDIEGAELTFLRNYPDLLRRIRRAVFELHPGLCDVDECRRLLAQAGLTRCEHLWDRPETFTDYFTRP